MQRNVLHLIDRLKYHAAIFLVVCNGIATIETARSTGCMYLKKVTTPFYPEMPPEMLPDACMVISVFIPQVALFCHPAS